MTNFKSCILLLSCLCLWSCRPDVPQVDETNNASLDSLLFSGIKEAQKLNFDRAQDVLNELLKKAEENQSSKHIILAYLNLGNLYNYYGLYDEALRYFLLSIEASEETGNDLFLNSIYNNIGIIYSENKAYDEARTYFEKALAISRTQQDAEVRVGLNLINLGVNRNKVHDDEAALRHFNEALNIFEALEDTVRLGTARSIIGNIQFDNGDFELALTQYQIAYNTANPEIEPWFRWEYALNIGKTYVALNYPDSAQAYISEALLGFESSNNQELEIESHKVQAEIDLMDARPKSAYQHTLKSLVLQDSILAEKTANWVSQKKLNYEFGKKEKELELLEATSARKQTITLLIGSLGVMLAILLGIIARARLNRLRQKNLLLEKEQSLSALRLETNRISQEKQAEEFASQEQVNKLEREKLQQEIDFKNRALVGKAMNLANQSEHFSSVQDILKTASENEQDQAKAIHEALGVLKSQENLENEWESFKVHFEEVHPNFFGRLARHNASLNAGDYRMCAYIILDLSPKEVAQLLNISPDSVRKRKQRLREKLNLKGQDNLTDWLKRTFLSEQ